MRHGSLPLACARFERRLRNVAGRSIAALFLVLLTGLAGGCGGAPSDAPPEHRRAYQACRGLMRVELERWRQEQRRDIDPENFQQQIRFTEFGSEHVSVTTLEPGLYEVRLRAEYPPSRFAKSPTNQSFTCRLQETWEKAGFTTWW